MLSFSKLQALGNDFVLIDARQAPFDPTPGQVRQLGDRRSGIGFDQLLILRDSQSADVCVDIHNQDGSRAEQCGNGMRAVALFLHDRQAFKTDIRLETAAGEVAIHFENPDRISATLPPPDLNPPPSSPLVDGEPWIENLAGAELALDFVDLGNPHLIIQLPAPVSHELLLSAGAGLSQHPALANGANVSFAHVVDRDHITLSVFERGAGPTLACGSGACATAVSLIHHQQVASTVNVDQPGGRLVIHWPGPGHVITMTGPARRVFEGKFDPNSLFLTA